jgi:hypothetical protein
MTYVTLSAKLFGFLALGTAHFTLPVSLSEPLAFTCKLGGIVELNVTATDNQVVGHSVQMDTVALTDTSGGDIISPDELHETADPDMEEFARNLD